MNDENIAGNAATGVVVFLAVVVAPQLSAWGAATSLLVSAAAVAIATTGAWTIARWIPDRQSARQLEHDAAWDHAWEEISA